MGELGKLPVHQPLRRAFEAPPQSATGNSAHRLRNVWGAFTVDPAELPPPDQLAGPVLVLDDALDSGWTMTVVAAALRGAGAGAGAALRAGPALTVLARYPDRNMTTR